VRSPPVSRTRRLWSRAIAAETIFTSGPLPERKNTGWTAFASQGWVVNDVQPRECFTGTGNTSDEADDFLRLPLRLLNDFYETVRCNGQIGCAACEWAISLTLWPANKTSGGLDDGRNGTIRRAVPSRRFNRDRIIAMLGVERCQNRLREVGSVGQFHVTHSIGGNLDAGVLRR